MLRTLFQRYPNLKYYIGASNETFNTWCTSHSRSVCYTLSFDEPAGWCPNLKYYITDGAYLDKGLLNYPIDDSIISIHENHLYNRRTINDYSNKKITATHTNDSGYGQAFYHTAIYAGTFRIANEISSAWSFVTESQQTLESFIFTESLELHCSPMLFRNYASRFPCIQQIPHLHTLICRYISFNTSLSIFSIIISRCPYLVNLEVGVTYTGRKSNIICCIQI